MTNNTSLDHPQVSDDTLNRPIFTFGNLTIDDIVLYDQNCMYLESSGGDALFSAIGAWIWHHPVGLIARAGIHYPQANIEKIQASGIDCYLHRVPYTDIRNWALYEPGGIRQFCNHRNSGSYEQMSIHGEEIPTDCLGAPAYHIAPIPVDLQQSVLSRLRNHPCLITLDTFTQHLQTTRSIETALANLSKLDCYLPSQEEAAILYGADDPQAAAKAFVDAGVGIVCIKLGEEGSLLYTASNDRFVHVPIFAVKTIDPTGAGDSFCGGFLAGLLQTGDPLTAASCGTVSASYVVETVGALQVLDVDLSERQHRLEQVRAAVIPG